MAKVSEPCLAVEFRAEVRVCKLLYELELVVCGHGGLMVRLERESQLLAKVLEAKQRRLGVGEGGVGGEGKAVVPRTVTQRHPSAVWVALAAQAVYPGKLAHYVELGDICWNCDSRRGEKGQVKGEVISDEELACSQDARDTSAVCSQGRKACDVAGRDSMHGLGGIPAAMPRRAEALVKNHPPLSVDDGQGKHFVAAGVEPRGLSVEDNQSLGKHDRFCSEL